MPNDPYSVLGVPRSASAEEIKNAYRRLAKQYHPDLHPNDPVAARKMNEINEAYEQIKNPSQYQQSQQSYQNTGSYGQSYSSGPYGQYQRPNQSGYGDYQQNNGDSDWYDIFQEYQRQQQQRWQQAQNQPNNQQRPRPIRLGRIILILAAMYFLLIFFSRGCTNRAYYNYGYSPYGYYYTYPGYGQNPSAGGGTQPGQTK